VFDATAESGIQYLLSTLSAERSIPYIGIDATRGGAGGTVVRLSDMEGAPCWGCVQLGIERKEIPRPTEDVDGFIQPEGCEDVTYVGSHFDLQEVSLQGVRLAVATLCRKYFSKYEDFSWNVGVLKMRDENGRRSEPRWSVRMLAKQVGCPVCG
jgi:hypothetical protein